MAVIAPAPECSNEPPTLTPTEFFHFNANYVKNRHGESYHINLSEIGFFKLFFSNLMVEILSEETNFYAESQLRNPPLSLHETRHWVPTTPAEILVFLGVYLYFGFHPTAVREEYWRLHNVGQYVGLKRYEQVHRFFSLNSKPPLSNAPWFYRIQRISELLRTVCRQAYSPSSNIAIDEAIVACRGRSRDTIKIKNKPINTGYKLWYIGDHGYIWSWLFHSRVDGVEGFTKGQQTRWPQQSVNEKDEIVEKDSSCAYICSHSTSCKPATETAQILCLS
jgi:Transposase IS4